MVKKRSGEFRSLITKINKYSDGTDIVNSNSDLVIDCSLLNYGVNKSRKSSDRYSYVGKITGFDGNFDVSENERLDNRKFFGSISVENNDGEEVVYNDGKKSSMHHNHSKKKINILGKRKPINGKKMKKNIITASIALVMSLVIAVSSYAAVKMMSNRTDSAIDSNKYTTISNDMKTNKYATVSKDVNTNIFEMEKTNVYDSLFANNVNDIMNVNSAVTIEKKDENKKDDYKPVEDEEKKQESIKISDRITIVDNASIYTNAYDACCENDGLDPYYDSNYVRNVRGVAFEDNNSVVFAYTQEEYDYLTNKGAVIKAVGCDDGFYNIDDVKTLSYSR